VRSALAPAQTATQLTHQQCGSPMLGREGRADEVSTSAILLQQTRTVLTARYELRLIITTQLTTLCVCYVILTWFRLATKYSCHIQGVISIAYSLGMADLLHRVCIRGSCHAEGTIKGTLYLSRSTLYLSCSTLCLPCSTLCHQKGKD
jgi:hypothetical protein